MKSYKHSVSLDETKCKGCTNCLKRCPTEAIRIRDGKAVIDSSRCIDCGECIRICPYKAKKAIYDKFTKTDKFKYYIALPAPAFYGQFDNLDDIDYILQGLIDYGFDDVYEVACAAEIVTEYTRRYLKDEKIQKPAISSACPVIVRLISLRFPYLCNNLIPILPPMEIAGKLAREHAMKQHPNLREKDICTVFISPCPAKVSYVKNGFAGGKSNIDYIISMSDMYFALVSIMKKENLPECPSQSGMIGISWASTSGEASALLNDRYLAADGIENVIKVLDEIENGNFPNLDFIELNACHGGCVGGALAVENPYIAKARLQTLRRYLPVSRNRLAPQSGMEIIPKQYKSSKPITYEPFLKLDDDRDAAIKMMSSIQEITNCLPALDCGSCGAPTCRAFAEDIVKGISSEDECIVRMREKIHEFLKSTKSIRKSSKEKDNT